MKRFAIAVTAAALLFSTCFSGVYGANADSGAAAQKKILLYLKPDLSVELNGVRQVFRNEKGQAVYPLIYNGTAYLPIRAVSAIMDEPIQWDSYSKTIYIGKTLENPEKSKEQISQGAAAEATASDITVSAQIAPSLVNGYLKSDILVMYDFAIQNFKDINGLNVYPVNYNGSVYLPVRAISKLMEEPVVWDGAEKKISIGDGKTQIPEEDEDNTDQDDESNDEDEADMISKAFEKMQECFDVEEALYYEATAKITNLKDADAAKRQDIAASASDNSLKAQNMTAEIKALDTESYTSSEKDAYDKLLAFAESNEYYILVLENIAYMAASEQDYSMLADTFLYFALDAQTKMETVQETLYSDPVY